MRTEKELQKYSVFLSGVLRHYPEDVGVQLDTEGYVDVDTLLVKLAQHNKPISKEELFAIVAQDQKKRYSLINGNTEIRCNQGHSTKQVKLTFDEVEPPEFLYHGTATRFVDAIDKEGLIAGNRHYVHLSEKLETASQVGKRHGELFMYKVEARRMSADGFKFYLSDNGVWLVTSVPAQYLLK
jgi:putative RNA 2'-phosphotransferase